MHSKTSFTKVNNTLANPEDLGMIEVVGRYSEKHISPTYFWEQLLINGIWTTPNMTMVSNACIFTPARYERETTTKLFIIDLHNGLWVWGQAH